ncbi:glycosyltransferase family 4 protein [Nesterenkonia populi]|uniref:glycosyltransferase family 4 protein n=1 Tax=Nesterenkonia populi TaxID=1591087 RepID=UPI0011BFA9F1|nr:glycosyltransferase family 1 protein [Nesterenkonia populi]
MRLFVDCRYVRTRVHDGISRYTASLVETLGSPTFASRAQVTMLISDPAQLTMLPDLPHLRISSPTSPREPLVPRQINPHSPDVVFSPMQTMGSAGRRYRLILTLHDLIYYQHRTPPRDLAAPVRAGWRLYHLSYAPQRWTLNRADAVATVSETTAGLITQHRLTKRPIHLIPNAPQPVSRPRDPGCLPARELLYMGSFMGYKNVEGIIEGLNRLPEYRLHLCSPLTGARRRELIASAADPDQLVFHDGISEEEYRALLHRAAALVTLSQAEGYGLPVIEAMSHGTPVIVSELPIFREIAGDAAGTPAAQVVTNTEELASAVRRLEAPDIFSEASQTARRRSAAYSWEDSAERLLAAAASAQSSKN